MKPYNGERLRTFFFSLVNCYFFFIIKIQFQNKFLVKAFFKKKQHSFNLNYYLPPNN